MIDAEDTITRHDALVELARRKAKRRFPAFFRCYPPASDYVFGDHTNDILEECDRIVKSVESGVCEYHVFSLPFRHGKSDIGERRLGPWTLARNPDWEIILADYNFELASEMSIDARRCMREFGPQYGLSISNERDQVGAWKLHDRKGAFFATGIGGTVTGRGANLLIIGDYLKSRRDAESATIRNHQWESFQSDLMTRLAPVHAVLFFANRWHEDDLPGRIKRKNDPNSRDYDPKFPKFVFHDYPAVRSDGSWLFEARFSPTWYETVRAALGTYAWNAQGLQNPQPRTGNMLRVDRVQEVNPATWPKNLNWVWGWDLASTRKEIAKPDPDYTVGTKLSYDGEKLRIAKVVRGQWNVTDRREHMKLVTEPHAKVRIEAVAGYKDTVPLAREWLANKTADIEEVNVNTDLVARCTCVENIFEAGNVEVPAGADWLPGWKEELGAFASGAHDDQVASMLAAAESVIVIRDGWSFSIG